MEGIELAQDYLILRQKPLILKLRSLGAGVEEAEETRITYLEAAYFAERGVIPLGRDGLLDAAEKRDPSARIKYSVLRYLRERGYVVRPSLDGTPYLRLHRKGVRPGEDKTYYLIEVVPEGWKAGMDSLLPSLEAAGRLRKELAIAVAGEGGRKPQFIKFSRMNFE